MKHQQGVTLIEVAVSIFILAVGLLGLASLQFMSLQNMQLAQRADNANIYLQQISESMRNNQTVLDTYVGSFTIDKTTDITCEQNCTSAQAAQASLDRIKNTIYTSFEKPVLNISSKEFGSYILKETQPSPDGKTTETIETEITVNTYTIQLAWKVSGNFLLRTDEILSKQQTLRVVL